MNPGSSSPRSRDGSRRAGAPRGAHLWQAPDRAHGHGLVSGAPRRPRRRGAARGAPRAPPAAWRGGCWSGSARTRPSRTGVGGPPRQPRSNNHANNAIDCGSAIDSLATLGRLHGERIPGDLRARLEWGGAKVARHILGAARDPQGNHRAAPLVGGGHSPRRIVGFASRSGGEAGLAAIEKESFPTKRRRLVSYTPLGTPRSHPGSADASAFYHSRPALFAAFALESFGEDPSREPWRGTAERVRVFVGIAPRRRGSRTASSRRNLGIGARATGGGVPFDAAALRSAAARSSEPRFARAAAEMFKRSRRTWSRRRDHLAPRPRVELSAASFGMHALRLGSPACALSSRPRSPAPNPRNRAGACPVSRRAGFARYADGAMVAHIRGKRPRART